MECVANRKDFFREISMAKKYANISPKSNAVVIVVVSKQLALIAFGSLLVVRVCVCVRGARYENIKNQFNEPFKQKYFFNGTRQLAVAGI